MVTYLLDVPQQLSAFLSQSRKHQYDAVCSACFAEVTDGPWTLSAAGFNGCSTPERTSPNSQTPGVGLMCIDPPRYTFCTCDWQVFLISPQLCGASRWMCRGQGSEFGSKSTANESKELEHWIFCSDNPGNIGAWIISKTILGFLFIILFRYKYIYVYIYIL